jgi:hypothetical protein
LELRGGSVFAANGTAASAQALKTMEELRFFEDIINAEKQDKKVDGIDLEDIEAPFDWDYFDEKNPDFHLSVKSGKWWKGEYNKYFTGNEGVTAFFDYSCYVLVMWPRGAAF